MLCNQNSLSLQHEIHAICWWYHQHAEEPRSVAWLAVHAYTDRVLERLNNLAPASVAIKAYAQPPKCPNATAQQSTGMNSAHPSDTSMPATIKHILEYSIPSLSGIRWFSLLTVVAGVRW